MEDGFLIGWDGMVQRKQDAMTSAILRSIMQEQLNEELLLEVKKTSGILVIIHSTT